MLEIRYEKEGLALILYVSGRLNTWSFEDFKDKVGFYVKEIGSTYLVLNLEDVEYIDSAGLGAIVAILFSLKRKNGSLKVVGASQFVSHVFEVTHFSDVVSIYPDVESALADIKDG